MMRDWRLKVAQWKKLLCINSNHTANLNFSTKKLKVRLWFGFL